MRVEIDATMVKVSTKRAKFDKEGQMVEEPAVVLSFELPVSALQPRALGALLRAVEREMRLSMDDHQASFDLADDGRLAPEREPVGTR